MSQVFSWANNVFHCTIKTETRTGSWEDIAIIEPNEGTQSIQEFLFGEDVSAQHWRICIIETAQGYAPRPREIMFVFSSKTFHWLFFFRMLYRAKTIQENPYRHLQMHATFQPTYPMSRLRTHLTF